MITEDYCSFEVAKLLKEKGFDVPCLAHWFIGTDRNFSISNTPQNWNEIKTDLDWLSCPTHQMAMKWLREEKNIFIVIEPHVYDYINEKNKSYTCSLWVGDNYYEYLESKDYPSYEEAVEVALKYSLENLI